MKTPERAAAHHHGVGVEQRLLAAVSDARKKDLPRVALAFGSGHRSDGNKVAMNGLRYHGVGAPPARLWFFRALPARGCSAPPPSGAIPEIRGDADHQHPVRPPRTAPGS